MKKDRYRPALSVQLWSHEWPEYDAIEPSRSR